MTALYAPRALSDLTLILEPRSQEDQTTTTENSYLQSRAFAEITMSAPVTERRGTISERNDINTGEYDCYECQLEQLDTPA